MKRFISAVILAAVSLVLFASTASAGQTTYRSGGYVQWRTTDLYATLVARDSRAALVQNSAGTSTAGYLDSTYTYTPVGSANGLTGKADTSAVFNLPNDFCYPTVADSIAPIMLVFRNTAAGASGDTVYAVMQANVGTAFVAQAGTVPALPTQIALSGAVTTGFWNVFKTATGSSTPVGSGSMSSTVPFNVELFPLAGVTRGFRVITFGDYTSAAGLTNNGLISCEVYYTTCPDR